MKKLILVFLSLSFSLTSFVQAAEIKCSMLAHGTQMPDFSLDSKSVVQVPGEVPKYARYLTKFVGSLGGKYIVSVGLAEFGPVTSPAAPGSWFDQGIYKTKRINLDLKIYQDRPEVNPEYMNYSVGGGQVMLPSVEGQVFFLDVNAFADKNSDGLDPEEGIHMTFDNIILSCTLTHL